ncbi:MAG: septum formation initiator family protein [Microbacteriaceae bacterium]
MASRRPSAAKHPPRQRTRKVEAALPAAESAPEHWLRHIRLSGLAVTVLGLVVLSIVVLAPGLRTLVEQRAQIAELKDEVASGQQAVDDLGDQIARWDDPAYIEAQARSRIYYAFPGEKIYLAIDDEEDEATEDDSTGVSDSIQSTQVDWIASIMGSLVTAGTTDDTAEELDEQ